MRLEGAFTVDQKAVSGQRLAVYNRVADVDRLLSLKPKVLHALRDQPGV